MIKHFRQLALGTVLAVIGFGIDAPTHTATAQTNQATDIPGTFWIRNVRYANSTLRLSDPELHSVAITAPSSIYQWTWTRWKFIKTGDFFHIKNVRNGGHLRPRNDSDNADIIVVPGDSYTGLWTQWSLEPVEWGGFRIINRRTGKFLGPGSSDSSDLAAVRSAPNNFDGSGTAWNLVSTTPTRAIGSTAYAGGGGTVAGALPHSCETQAGFTEVSSLAEMSEAMGRSNVKVRLKRGSYSVGTDDMDLFNEGTVLFPVTGSNSVYDFRCTYIGYDTAVRREFGRNSSSQLHTLGNNNLIRHLTLEDLGDSVPTGGAVAVTMDGRDNVIEGAVITIRGANPYGLGDAYGKGGGSVLSHKKHSGVLIRGLRSVFRQSTVRSFSYGHSVFMQGSADTLIDGVYVQGESRSTDDMLAANNPRFAAADARAAGVNFILLSGDINYLAATG